jgi:hypothetical protein
LNVVVMSLAVIPNFHFPSTTCTPPSKPKPHAFANFPHYDGSLSRSRRTVCASSLFLLIFVRKKK